MSENRMDEALRASYRELVEEIRATTDMGQARANVYARIRERPRSTPLEVPEERPDSTTKPTRTSTEQPAPTSPRPARVAMDASINVRLIYRLLLAVAIEKYSTRDAREQLRAQTDLRNILNIAAENVDLDRKQWYEQVSGDGELAVLPQDTDVSLVVGDFTRQLQLILAEFNQRHTRSPRLRIRVALHHGTLTPGPLGPAGEAPIVVSRLLNAEPLRRVLADHPERDAALIVSSSLYRDVVSTGFCGLDPDSFEAVHVFADGVLDQGYLWRRVVSMPSRSEATIPAVPPS